MMTLAIRNPVNEYLARSANTTFIEDVFEVNIS